MDGHVSGPDGTPEPAGDLGAELRDMWEQLDPVPAGLTARIGFALEVEAFTRSDLELELMRLQQPRVAVAGARGEQVRTVTFGSESLTVMLAISDVDGGHRVDGWVAPGGPRDIEVRTSAGTSAARCDQTGRFALPVVPPGHFQLVLADLEAAGTAEVAGVPDASAEAETSEQAPEDGSARPSVAAGRTIITPALTL